jgi:hypothetical protein
MTQPVMIQRFVHCVQMSWRGGLEPRGDVASWFHEGANRNVDGGGADRRNCHAGTVH